MKLLSKLTSMIFLKTFDSWQVFRSGFSHNTLTNAEIISPASKLRPNYYKLDKFICTAFC